MGYLICENCKGYYKLQPGEKQDDFNDRCACGGKLRYAIDIEVVGNQQLDHYYNSRQSNEKQSEKGIPPNNDPFNNNDKKNNNSFKIFIYCIVAFAVLNIIWAFYWISGTVFSVLGLLIVIFLGYNTPKNKIVKYTFSYGLISTLLTSILGGGVSPFEFSGIVVILIWIGLNMVLGYVGMYLKMIIKKFY